MSIIGSNILAGASGQAGDAGAYEIERSLRFNSSDSAYLSRTPASAGNRKTWTWAGWVKRSGLGGGYIFTTTNSDVNSAAYLFFSSDKLRYWDRRGSADGLILETSAVYRDISAWYHIVLAVNYSAGASADRAKLFVNGVEQAYGTASYPGTSEDSYVNATVAHYIGPASVYFNGYLADIHFIDGQALTPSSFTEVSATTGQLVPIEYTGTFGTNGFHLPFSNNSTAAALGTDTSGNGNTWTVNNLSVTAGAGNDSLVDTPTSYGTDTGAGGEVRGNYATLNPLNNSATLSNGNLQSDAPTATWYSTVGTIYVSSGKWYWEVTPTALGLSLIGVANKNVNTASNAVTHDTTNAYTYYNFSGNKFGPTSNNTGYGATYAANDVIGVALDMDNGTIVFYKNNTSQGTAYSGLTGIELAPFVSIHDYVSTGTLNVNFGQRAFAYTAPSGFKALCDTNLPAPLVALPNTVMDVKLYTGNGSTQTISGLGFSPDFVWTKARNTNYSHQLIDIIRGGTNVLFSDRTDAAGTFSSITAFNSDGYTVSTELGVNGSGDSFVAWTWDAGANSSKTYTVTVASAGGANRYFIDGVQQATINLEEGSTYIFDQSAASNSNHPLRFSTTSNGTHGGGTGYTTGVTTVGTPGNAGAYTQIAVASGAPALYYYCTNHSQMGGAINTNTTAGASNFVGSITSTVRANVSAGFSIVTATYTSGTNSYGHGLGVKPAMYIVKNRSSSQNWQIWHQGLSNETSAYLQFTTAAQQTYSTMWAASTSTTISLADGPVSLGDNFVAYVFAPVDGYSSFGSYTGNGSVDGPFVYTGFRPRWLLVKNATNGGSWVIHDMARSTYNVSGQELLPDSAGAEYTFTRFDFLSNGFKGRTTNNASNTSSDTYIYAAFAENPFQYARAR